MQLSAMLADDLALIAEMTADFALSQNIEETLRVGLEHICLRLEAEAASLFLLDGDDLVCRACWGPSDVVGLRLQPGRGIVWRTVEQNACQLVRDTALDPDFSNHVDQKTGFQTRSILCAPLSVRNEKLGAIELFNKTGGRNFNTTDQRVLQALAASAALALINARQAAAMAEQQALQRELALAANIQRAMLPPTQPERFPIHGLNQPARGVSGDFYDVVALPGDRLAFAIADVSGKGMNAALLMSKTASLFRCLAKRLDGPGAILQAIDAELAETCSAGMFVTMIAGLLDCKSGRVVLSNAGHEPPVLISENAAILIEGNMPPLGIDPMLFSSDCPETVVDLHGGSLYLFTDGLTEADCDDGSMWGSEGIRDLARELHPLPMQERLQAFLQRTAPPPPLSAHDDVTVMVVQDCPSRLHRRYPAMADSLGHIRHGIQAMLGTAKYDAGVIQDVVLAVDEACQNIVRHAYAGLPPGDLVVQAEMNDQEIRICLTDFAPPVDPSFLSVPRLDDLRPGGLGTHFMLSVMDDVRFLPPPAQGGNVLQMVKRMRML